MRIIFFGTPSFVVPVLQALSHWVYGVVTTPDRKVGRKQILTESPVGFHSHGPFYGDEYDPKSPYEPIMHQSITLKPERFDKETIQQLKDLTPDFFVVAAYGKILPKEVLDIPKYGSVNIHPSLLPKYRGPSPIQAAILNGDKETGVTLILMDEQMDHGPILWSKKVELTGDETFETLPEKLFRLGVSHMEDVLEKFANKKLKPVEQDHTKATFCKEITKEDGFIDPKNPPSKEKVDRMIRAFYPWPGAWTNFNGKILKIYRKGIVQLEGKTPVSADTFIKGYPESKDLLEKLGVFVGD